MASESIPQGSDGFYHPASEAELVALVKSACAQGRQLRVRGAAHSVSHAIYTDPLAGTANHVSQQSPPAGEGMNVMLDRYRGWRVVDEQRRRVEADAGIHLGADPSDPTGTATLESSLLWQLWKQQGWTLSDSGGITHQTVSGFTATGSAGGSVQFSVNQNLVGIRLIDGAGEVHALSVDDSDPDEFFASFPNLGLLGVVSTVTFECVETFNISGQEAITTVAGCAVDLLGPGGEGRPSLETFLREADYARIEWWPQPGVDRVLVWQAERIRPEPGFEPVRYQEFTDHPEAAEVAISILFTIIGNLDDLSRAKPKLEATFDQLAGVLELLAAQKGLGEIGKLLAKVLGHALEFGVDAAITMLEPLAGLIRRELPSIYPRLLAIFVPLDSDKPGSIKGEPQSFQDWAWQGLPMDNEADDTLVPTEFTELWIPLERTQQVMRLLDDYFTAPADDHEAYRRIGTYAWELYAAMPTRFWMAASHTDGEDEWKHGAFRVDPYWFVGNAGDPAAVFYPQLWQLLRAAGVPFRLHWAKFQPVYERGDREWVDWFRAHYPRWEDFLSLRERRDPNNIFLTSYWRDRFGLWDAPAPAPRP